MTEPTPAPWRCGDPRCSIEGAHHHLPDPAPAAPTAERPGSNPGGSGFDSLAGDGSSLEQVSGHTGESGRYVEVTMTWRVPIESPDNGWIHEVVGKVPDLVIADARAVEYRCAPAESGRGQADG